MPVFTKRIENATSFIQAIELLNKNATSLLWVARLLFKYFSLKINY